VNLENPAEPALAQRIEKEYESRKVPEHITHLDGEFVSFGLLKNVPKSRKRFTRRLIQMNVLSRGDTSSRSGNEFSNLRLDGNSFEARGTEQLLFDHPFQSVIGFRRLHLSAPILVRFDYSHYLEYVAELPHGTHLASGVAMFRADLTDLDLRFRDNTNGAYPFFHEGRC
jgi:hypothetical protein